MKRVHIIFSLALAAVLALSACAAPAGSGPADAPPSPGRAYALEKLNQVNDMVLNRQLIPEDYLRYLDGITAEKTEAYNAALVNAKITTLRYAKNWADGIRDMSALPEDSDEYDAAFAGYGRYLEEGDNYFRFIEEFSTALLYPNHTDFTMFGAVVGYPAGCEAGGSGGMWATGFYLDQDPMDELTAAVNDLLDQCGAARAGWTQTD